MYGRSCTRLLALSLVILSPAILRGQSDQPRLEFPFPRSGPTQPEPGLRRRLVFPSGAIGFQQIAHAAGTIFSGTVTAITRHPATHAQAVETVAITRSEERRVGKECRARESPA